MANVKKASFDEFIPKYKIIREERKKKEASIKKKEEEEEAKKKFDLIPNCTKKQNEADCMKSCKYESKLITPNKRDCRVCKWDNNGCIDDNTKTLDIDANVSKQKLEVIYKIFQEKDANKPK